MNKDDEPEEKALETVSAPKPKSEQPRTYEPLPSPAQVLEDDRQWRIVCAGWSGLN